MTRTKRLVAAAAATALTVGAVGIAVAVAPANADPDDQPAAPVTVTQVAASAANDVTATTSRGNTVVAFDAAAVEVLAPLQPEAISPGSFTLVADDVSVVSAFPIVGNGAGLITHAGGLTFTDGPNTVTLLNYTINTQTQVLTARAFLNGDPLGTVPFLDLSPRAAQAGCDTSVGLELAPATAFVLSDAFGAADLSGATIGSACVSLR